MDKGRYILAIDIGNTTVTMGVMADGLVVQEEKAATYQPQRALKKELKRVLTALDRRYGIRETLICSVVPPVTEIVRGVIIRELGEVPFIVGRDIKVPIKNKYRKPKQVGQDRLVGAYAALRLYGKPAIVIDLGTAITLDVVSARSEYLGGMIIPGLRLSAETLFQKTALLPRIDIEKPGPLIGKDTRESILSGLFYGYGAMMGGLIRKITKELRSKPVVVVTGGHTELIRPYIDSGISCLDQYLVLRGLFLLAHNCGNK